MLAQCDKFNQHLYSILIKGATTWEATVLFANLCLLHFIQPDLLINLGELIVSLIIGLLLLLLLLVVQFHKLNQILLFCLIEVFHVLCILIIVEIIHNDDVQHGPCSTDQLHDVVSMSDSHHLLSFPTVDNTYIRMVKLI